MIVVVVVVGPDAGHAVASSPAGHAHEAEGRAELTIIPVMDHSMQHAKIKIGQYNTLVVHHQTSSGLYLTPRLSAEEANERSETSGLTMAERAQILLPWATVPEGTQVDQEIRVFVYTDSEDRPIATTKVPKAVVGEFVFMEVIDTSPHGVFLDWGLDKDLFAPLNEQHSELKIGDRFVFAVTLDERTGRVRASSRLRHYLDYDVQDVKMGDEVDMLVYGRNEVGVLVVVDNAHAGIVYHDEFVRPLKTGNRLRGFVKKVREDNKLDIRLQRNRVAAIEDAQQVLLDALWEEHGFLSLHDKSPPEEIRRRLGISKKAFKRGLGGLYKARKVKLEPDGIRLLDDD